MTGSLSCVWQVYGPEESCLKNAINVYQTAIQVGQHVRISSSWMLLLEHTLLPYLLSAVCDV